jgi:signal transduction histidine kinase/CheY-like chemotaxis protein/HAMP domain-containing protein
MMHGRGFSRVLGLREATSTIFALVALLPLLLLLSLLWRYELVAKTEVQVSLLLALVIALLGFLVLQRVADRISHLARVLETGKTAGAASVANVTDVPGLGSVTEIGEIAGAFNRLLEDLRTSTARLEDLVFKLGTLNQTVELAARIPKIQDLLALVLERTMRTVRASIGSIMLVDPQRQTLRIAVAQGLAEEVVTGAEVRLGDGIAGKVAQLGEPVLVDDIERDPRFARPNNPKYGGGSFICIPVRVGDRIIGVINLARGRGEATGSSASTPFNATDLQFLNALMSYIAYAVENARLLEEARQSARQLEEVVRDQQLRLTVAQQQMLHAEKLSALGHLVAGVAHELNNPLTVLLGAGHLLGDQAPQAMRPAIAQIVEQARRSRDIVQGLLTFARRVPPERRRVDLAEVLDKTLAVAAADLRLAGITIERDVAADLPPLWADAGQLQQVLVNLITNAKQAMEEVDRARELRIVIRRSDASTIHIRVQDTGPGIPPDRQLKIFDPFMTTKGAKGTGLGLSVSHGIVSEHGGRLTVESTVGRGSVFTIELPVGTPSEPAPAEAAPGPSESLAGQRILVAEVDSQLQRLFRAYLETVGCQPTIVSTAEAALQALEKPVDLLVCDLNLPGTNGLNLYREAVAHHPDLAGRLLVTGGFLSEADHGGLATANGKFLRKPFSCQDLLDAVREVLGRAAAPAPLDPARRRSASSPTIEKGTAPPAIG